MDDPKIVHPEFLNMWWDTYIANVLPLLEQHGIVKEITTGVNMVRALIFLCEQVIPAWMACSLPFHGLPFPLP